MGSITLLQYPSLRTSPPSRAARAAVVAAVAVLSSVGGAAPSSLPAPPAQGSGSAVEASLDDLRNGAIPARAGDLELTWDEFHAAVLDREGGGETAKAALIDIGERVLLEDLAARDGVRVTEEDLAERFAELDAQVRSQGSEGGLAAMLDEAGVPLSEFKARLRLQIVLEQLVRRDLAIPEDRQCPEDQQQLWLDAKVGEAGLELLPRPWVDGVAARMGEHVFTGDVLAPALTAQLPPEELRELCFQLLLAKAVEARLPDLSAEGRRAAIDAEVARRRAEAEADPRYQGVAFERLLDARGLSLELLARDPAVRIAALSTHFVDAANGDGPDGEGGLRRAYEAERDWFEDRFGRSVSSRILYMIAAPERGPLTPRNFADATEVLVDLAGRIAGEDDFDRLARLHSEDPLSRERGGRLGFVTRAAEGVPPALREAIFTQVDAGQSGLVGPLRLDNGVALLWIGAVRPSPPWERMRDNVHRELRRRFLIETLPPSSVTTYLDPGR